MSPFFLSSDKPARLVGINASFTIAVAGLAGYVADSRALNICQSRLRRSSPPPPTFHDVIPVLPCWFWARGTKVVATPYTRPVVLTAVLFFPSRFSTFFCMASSLIAKVVKNPACKCNAGSIVYEPYSLRSNLTHGSHIGLAVALIPMSRMDSASLAPCLPRA